MFYAFLVYVLFSLPALVWLGKRKMAQTPQAIWALITVGIPMMGAVALLLVKPGEPQDREAKFELEEFRRQ
jgi:hypothetical protein